jgi:hypothetical protein
MPQTDVSSRTLNACQPHSMHKFNSDANFFQNFSTPVDYTNGVKLYTYGITLCVFSLPSSCVIISYNLPAEVNYSREGQE